MHSFKQIALTLVGLMVPVSRGPAMQHFFPLFDEVRAVTNWKNPFHKESSVSYQVASDHEAEVTV